MDEMGPVLWWWRWWTGDDPTRDRQLDEARTLLDEQRTRSAELTEQLRTLDAELAGARAEADQLAAYRNELDQTRREAEQLRARVAELEAELAAARTDAEPAAAATDAEPAAHEPPDVSTAADVLGTTIKADDLTVIDGIGPKIAGLLADAGIDSWRALGAADVERLHEVLTAAGPRYRMHDPSAWPAQAELLAAGRWEEFADRSGG
jgi:predicted flap endonuclease-1-like 5' DNA nuclease